MNKVHINNSNINYSQVGSDNSTMIINTGNNNNDWEQIEIIWLEALQNTNTNIKLYNLVKEANELTKKKDKTNLKKLILNFWSEFTKEILTEKAVEVVLKFLM